MWSAKGLARLLGMLMCTCPSFRESAAPLPDPAQQAGSQAPRMTQGSFHSTQLARSCVASVASVMAGQRMLLLLLTAEGVAQGATGSLM